MTVTKEQVERLKNILSLVMHDSEAVRVPSTDLAALLSAWEEMQPRPIEGAPKDGAKLIGFTSYGAEIIKWCDWDGKEYAPYDGWIGLEQDSGCLPPNFRREVAMQQPTHFIPLSALPKPESEQ